MTVLYRYRKIIIIGIIVLIIFTSSGYFLYENIKDDKTKKVKEEKVLATKLENSKEKKQIKEETEEVFYKVDIKGEVISPGLYSLKEGSRVSDVINMAGGLTENGDTTVINLSKKVVDEMVIIIYSKYEVSNFKVTKEVEKKVIDSCINANAPLTNDACINQELTEEKEENTLLSINTATKEELQTLSGIGEAKATSIIKYREEHGNFTTIEDIKNVEGIGDSLFDQIKDHITV